MCGIAGILDLDGSREINREALTRMSKALSHRGPDGDGYFIAPGIGLAHQRLAIIDIEGGCAAISDSSARLRPVIQR